MSIQIACHKCITDKLTNKLLTNCLFIHFVFLMTNTCCFIVHWCNSRHLYQTTKCTAFSCSARKKNFLLAKRRV